MVHFVALRAIAHGAVIGRVEHGAVLAEADGDGRLVGGLAPLIVAHDVGVFHWMAEILRESIRNSSIRFAESPLYIEFTNDD